jgi:twitching motility protein PilT
MSYESIFKIYATSNKEIDRIFNYMMKFKASDLHIKANAPPVLRIGGQMRALDMSALNEEQCKNLIFEIMNADRQKHYLATGDVEFTHMISDGQRFRINVFRERGTIALSARLVPSHIPKFEELGLPREIFEKIISAESGLILLSGATGSGKSTSIASMIEYINQTRRCHIITIEDPIEFLYKDKKAFINQREVGRDVMDFSAALKNLVRQDPDVIVAGELRDFETFSFGVTAAETGHLVFGTLHASTSTHIVSRILDLFPAERHEQIRQSIAFNLRAVICQKLLPSIKKGHNMIPALEILLINSTAKKLILDRQEGKLINLIRSSRLEGMIDFTHSLADLINREYISREVGMANAPNPEALHMVLQGIDIADDQGIINR